MLLVISCAFVNKQSFSSARGQWRSKLWCGPCFEFKTERREVWRKNDNYNYHWTYHNSVIEEQINLQFRINSQSWFGVWDQQFEYIFTDETRKPSFSWTSQVFGFEKTLFYQEICLPMRCVNFRKMWKVLYTERQSS